MLSSIERKRLMNTMCDEPVNAWIVLTKCAVGLAIILLLVVLVVSDERVMNGSLTQGIAPPRAAAAGMSAEEHRRHVFVERQQRFQGVAGQRSYASEMAERSDQFQAVIR